MRILIAAAGSHGDVLPFIGLGQELKRRGCTVTLFASGVFGAMAAEVGLELVEVLSEADYRRSLADRDATHPRRGLALLAQAVMASQRRCLTLLERACEPGRTLIVGSSLAWASRLAGERQRVPVATVHLAPSWFRSDHSAPAIGPLGHLEGVPSVVKRLIWRLMDRHMLDPLFGTPFNALRAELGLKPVRRPFHRWIHGADLTLGLFPAWFAPPQPDWPGSLRLTGFPLYDHGADRPLPEAVVRFLEAGEPPVAFTAGTANASSHEFFATSVKACRLAGRRGLLLAQDASQLPSELPPNVAHFGYVPFKALLPRLSALVHHGGIGTASQALRAGVPQLVRPMGFDQFDNALRLRSLGVAERLLPRQYHPEPLAKALERLTTSPTVLARSSELASRLATEGASLAQTAEAVLDLTARLSR